MAQLEETLQERGSRYGTFTDNGRIAQRLKYLMRTEAGWVNLSFDQQEALDMIASKISRILSGDPNYPDNWHDIGGYAKVVEDALPSVK